MAIKQFEDLIVWQKSQDLAVEIYKEFGNIKEFGFRDQITRAVVSISNNIAEGFNRSSNADFSRFLYYSISSCSELQSMLYLAPRIGLSKEPNSKLLIEKSKEISRLLNGLINSVNKRATIISK